MFALKALLGGVNVTSDEALDLNKMAKSNPKQDSGTTVARWHSRAK